MEVALVSMATGALKPVLGKLGALLGDKYKRFNGVRKEIKYLTHDLAAMDAFLMKMSEDEDPEVQDKVWMNEVRELSYDMEDSINDFMQSVNDKDTKPDGFMEKIKHLLGKMKAHCRIRNEIKDLKKQIVEVGDRNGRYKNREAFSKTINATKTHEDFSKTINAIADPRSLVIYDHASELVGIDEPKAEIIKMLTQEDGHALEQHSKLVSIAGSGEMGKTTLANQVYQELKGQFDCSAFLSVSRNPDMTNILRTILSEVTGQDYAITEAGSTQQLISKIRDFLVGKRYFIVIDDIWAVETWDVIKRVFPMSSYSSRVITTTRITDVAEACHSTFSGNIYSIRPLNFVHSRQLFHRRLLDSKEDFPSHLEEVSDQILQKCEGLPLAVITIAGLLANRERTEDLWTEVKDSIGRALERNHGVKTMMQILSLSYFDLPPHLKSCLLYMSMFPEDAIIERKDLIRRWIGEGFIPNEETYTVYELGERCFNELVNRGLIQPVMNGIGRSKLTGCRVHDIILDFVISKSIEENFVTIVGVSMLKNRTQSKVARRLSLQFKQGNSTIPTTGLVLSHVRSFDVFGQSVEIPSLEEFRHLRVLHLNYRDEVQSHGLKNMVGLFQLRYLKLRGMVRELPKQIGRLGCLEMLDLRDTRVEKLPVSIVNLGKLTHLLVDSVVKFPVGIAKMQSLETLKKVIICIQPFDFLCGLGQLKNLRNLTLESMSDRDEEGKKAIVSSLCKLGTQNLHSLVISDGRCIVEEPLCLVTVKKLITQFSCVQQLPKWASSLRNLQHLFFALKTLKQDDLCTLGALPALLILDLFGFGELNEKLIISAEVGFRLLRTLSFDMFRSVNLRFAAGSMPKVQELELCLYAADADSLGIENLPSLLTFGCHVLGDSVKASKAALDIAASTHPNRPTLLCVPRKSSIWCDHARKGIM